MTSRKLIQETDKKGFSIAEVLVTLLLVTIALAATIPIMTRRSHDVGTDIGVIGCITRNATDIVFDAATANITSYPTSGSCYGAYYGCQQGKNDDCNTIFSYADTGTANQKIAALKILRASCDKGGSKACDYFLSRCMTNQTNCSSPDANYTLRYYLNAYSNIVTTSGRSYIETVGKNYYLWNTATFNTEINNTCSTCVNYKTACAIKGCAGSF